MDWWCYGQIMIMLLFSSKKRLHFFFFAVGLSRLSKLSEKLGERGDFFLWFCFLLLSWLSIAFLLATSKILQASV